MISIRVTELNNLRLRLKSCKEDIFGKIRDAKPDKITFDDVYNLNILAS